MVKKEKSQNNVPSLVEDDSTDPRGTSCRRFKEFLDEGVIGTATLELTNSMGFTKTSPVQDAVIPVFLKQDVAVEACTGSGKTLAFLIPVVEILLRSSAERKMPDGSSSSAFPCLKGVCRVGALILGPTRELVIQIHTVLKKYLKFVNQSNDLSNSDGTGLAEPLGLILSLLFTGGSDISSDVSAIQRTGESAEHNAVVIATPGRISHLLGTMKLNTDWSFRSLEVLVLDEADRLLLDRASFECQLSVILDVLPKQRRTGLFSATLTAEMKSLIKAGMRDPLLIRVTLNSEAQPTGGDHQGDTDRDTSSSSRNSNHSANAMHAVLPDKLHNYFATLDRRDKFAFLLKFLLSEIFPPLALLKTTDRTQGKKCILFFATCNCVNVFHKLLSEIQSQRLCPSFTQDVTIERLFGKMQQKARLASWTRFSEALPSRGALLIATDVAARGLDCPEVDWIVQFDAPLDPAMYIHRIGRTARADRSGNSLLLICPPEEACVPFLKNRKVPLNNIDSHHLLLNRIQQVVLADFLFLPSVEDTSIFAECPSSDISIHENAIGVSYADFKRAWEMFRCFITSDKDILLKASAAFVSFIRAYKEHHLQYIFPFEELEIGKFATSLALLRIPRVREILGKPIEGFNQSSLNPNRINFKDPNREKEFQLSRERRKQAEMDEKPTREKKKSAKDREEKQTAAIKPKRTTSEQRRAKRRKAAEEWDDLALEERSFKKLRRGKISEEHYEQILSHAKKITTEDQDCQLGSSDDDGCSSISSDSHRVDNSRTAAVDIGGSGGWNRGHRSVAKWVKGGRRGGKKKR